MDVQGKQRIFPSSGINVYCDVLYDLEELWESLELNISIMFSTLNNLRSI